MKSRNTSLGDKETQESDNIKLDYILRDGRGL